MKGARDRALTHKSYVFNAQLLFVEMKGARDRALTHLVTPHI